MIFKKAARWMRAIPTLMVLAPAIGAFLLHGYLIKFMVAEPVRRRKLHLRNIQSYSKFALGLMRINVDARIEGRWTPAVESQLLVSNHMSWLDMLVQASIKPSVFVTSIDMGQKFFLGTMAEIAGAVFIERRNRDRVAFDITQLEEVLRQGFDVTLFPEGTSGDGSGILPFKRSMFLAAINTRKPVRPLTLRYVSVDGKPFGPANRDTVCWYGEMDFVSHLFNLCGVSSVVAEVTVHPALEFDARLDKHALAEAARNIIAREYSRTPQFEDFDYGAFYAADLRIRP